MTRMFNRWTKAKAQRPRSQSERVAMIEFKRRQSAAARAAMVARAAARSQGDPALSAALRGDGPSASEEQPS